MVNGAWTFSTKRGVLENCTLTTLFKKRQQSRFARSPSVTTTRSHMPALTLQLKARHARLWSGRAAPWEHSELKWRRKPSTASQKDIWVCVITPHLTWASDAFVYKVCTKWSSAAAHRVAAGSKCLLNGWWISKWWKCESAQSSRSNFYLEFSVLCVDYNLKVGWWLDFFFFIYHHLFPKCNLSVGHSEEYRL